MPYLHFQRNPRRAVAVAISRLLAVFCALPVLGITLSAADPVPETDPDWNVVSGFLSNHCLDCHQGTDPEGGLNLEPAIANAPELGDQAAINHWVSLHDRVMKGEMPPESDLSDREQQQLLQPLASRLSEADLAIAKREGRAVWRRMNRYEYENTLRDLLHAPWLQVRNILPEDGESHLFNKVGQSLDTSHVQLSRYLQAATYALRQVIVDQPEPPEIATARYYARQQPAFVNRLRFNQFNRSPERAVFPLLDHEPDLRVLEDERAPASFADVDPVRKEREAFGVVASSYEPLELRFDEFKAAAPGRYKLRFHAYTFWAGPGELPKWWRPSRSVASIGRTTEPVTIYSQSPPRLLRRLGAFDVKPEPTVQELEVYLLAGETIRPDAARLFRSRPPNWHNPLAEEDGMPGVAFYWMEAEGPLHETSGEGLRDAPNDEQSIEWPPPGHRVLFDDLPVEHLEEPTADGLRFQLLTADPDADARRLLARFMKQAYRRPVDSTDVEEIYHVVQAAFDAGGTLAESLLVGYSAVLCSPEFVSFQESRDGLSDHELATRLSYFLTNSTPDQPLRTAAAQAELHATDRLAEHVDRLIDSPGFERFVDAFLSYWLDLRRVGETSPDEFLYNDYYLDDLLVESAAQETRRYFLEVVRQNLDVSNLIDSDFAFVNQALAAHYDLPGVDGVALQRVALPANSPRGGLLTQASVLKITANGTNTSPVTRGAWVMERLLGQKPPPPPPSVPGLEPDTRGATTIREQLAKHRELESCNRCHRHIDPVGFALESFDVLGGWREKYRTLSDDTGAADDGFGKNGQPLKYRLGQDVDCSGQLPDGRAFTDIRELKAMLLQDQRQIARNFVQQVLIYATGALPRFSDRPQVEQILDRARTEDQEGVASYPVRTLMREIATSPLFTMK